MPDQGAAPGRDSASDPGRTQPAPIPDTGLGSFPEPGRVELVAPGVRRVTAPNPGVMTGTGTNSYLVGDRDLAVVDPGPDDPGHLRVLEEAAAGIGGRIRWILVTHTHPDHAPGAGALARSTGALRVGYAARDGFVPEILARDGWRLDTGTATLRAVHTPGHTSDHLCWLLEEGELLFSGDHVMDRVTVVISPPDGDMSDYLASLRRVLSLDPAPRLIAPGHGRLLSDPDRVVSAVIEHRLAREGLVARALADAGEATPASLVPAVYRDVAPSLYPVAVRSLWAHLRKLARDGMADEVTGPASPSVAGEEGGVRYRWLGAPSTSA